MLGAEHFKRVQPFKLGNAMLFMHHQFARKEICRFRKEVFHLPSAAFCTEDALAE